MKLLGGCLGVVLVWFLMSRLCAGKGNKKPQEVNPGVNVGFVGF